MKVMLYRELVELYKKGELKRPADNMLFYHLSERRRELGDKYIILDHWDNFLNSIKLGEELQELHDRMLWGNLVKPSPVRYINKDKKDGNGKR